MSSTATPLAPAAPAAPAAPPSIPPFLGDLQQELATTRRVLERVPLETHADWKPHPKSWTLGQLAAHLCNIPGWGIATLTSDGLDFAQPMERPEEPRTREALVERFDENARAFTATLGGMDAASLGATWTARRGEHVIFALPRTAILRSTIVSHMIHHRAQLGVYLRLLDVAVPAVYGPSADEGTF
jgi:uncharacterized damage-inducible protein DinB